LLFFTTSVFRNSFQKLTKRDDSGYISCRDDISICFKEQSFDDIYVRNHLLRQMGGLRVIKIRIQNSHLTLSSAAGYRLIICCNPTKNHIVFLDIYPKRGKYSKSDLLPSEFKDLLKVYSKELKDGSLQKF
jgi:mRNA-degrading endonuclease RelE of RelBE toxin-antitoxin system